MDKSLSEQQEMLLLQACKENGGTLPVSMAEGIYSSKSSAKSAIQKLKLFDYIELRTPGYFEVVKLPSHLKQELKEIQKDDGTDGSEDDSSEFVAESSKSVEVP
jgi:hypothetical protein